MRRSILSLFIVLSISLSFFHSFKAQAVMGDYLFMWGAEFYIQFPVYTAVDGNGNVYVTDHSNHRIQVYAPNGKILTEWGSFGSDDGQFNKPYGVAVNGSGNVYVVDSSNNRIQVFAPNGTFLRKWGSLWHPALGGDGHGQFNYPYGISVDKNNNVYVSDYGNHRIQVFTSDGTFIKTWGSQGVGDGQFNFPFSIAVDKVSGDIYVADGGNHRIQVFNSDGTFSRKWGGMWHPGSPGDGHGLFYFPYGVTVDGSGNVFVADTYNHRIQKFTSDGVFITTWGSYGSDDGQFKSPYGVTVDGSGKLYVADRSNKRIQIFDLNGTFQAKWENYGDGDGQLYYPFDVALDKSGKIYVADYSNHRIQVFNSEGQFVNAWGSYGVGNGQFRCPKGVAIDGSGNVFVVDKYNNRIQVFDSDGGFIRTWGSPGSAYGQFDSPEGIALDGSGNVYVADSSNYRIQVFSSDGTFIKAWGSFGTADGQFRAPCGVAIDNISGDIYVADSFNYRIQVFDSDGIFIRTWGSFGTDDGQFNFPFRLAMDKCRNLYVSDCLNDRIQVFLSDGTFLGRWGGSGSTNGKLSYPSGMAVDENFNVYVSEALNYRVQVFNGAELAVCQDITIQLNTSGNAIITPEYVYNGFCCASCIASMDVSPNVFTCADIGANTVTLTVTDAGGTSSNCNAIATVEDNILPELGDISALSDPIPLNTNIDVYVLFTEACPDADLIIWDWGDENTSTGTIDEINGRITGNHTYNIPGVYELKVTLTDIGGNTVESRYQYIVVYDPDGGFVTGGGWIDSPAGAYTSEPDFTGKANFGFVSKYKRGTNTPTGKTVFNFNVANMNFYSDSYDWLVVAGAHAQFKGIGTINGTGNYGFMLTAIDAALTPITDVDLFRIKIWDKDNGDEIIYDNQMDTPDDTDPTTEVRGGSIVINDK